MTKTRLTKALLCQPTDFQVKYVINPWMQPGQVNSTQALHQWRMLVKALTALNVEVETIDQEPNQPDMVFAVDQGVVKNDSVYLSNFFHPERQAETDHYQQWFKDQKYQLVDETTGTFEGGECLAWSNKYFLGTGFRSSKNRAASLSKFLDAEVIPLELIDSRYYHLDVCFFPLSEDTAFYYPWAFSQTSADRLKKEIPHLIEFSQAQVDGFCANSVVIGDTVLVSKGNASFCHQLETLRYLPWELDVSQFMLAGGGLHCLTLPLSYQTSKT